MITQLSLFDDIPPRETREAQPLVKYINGHWCWKEIGKDTYQPAPALERVLLERMRRDD